jgi:hypothetical protein
MGYNKIVVRGEENFPPIKNRVAANAKPKGKERKIKMDKTKTYILQFNEERNRWEINSNDLLQFGYAYDTCLINEEKDFAAALAVLDLCGYDLGIIQEELGIEKGERK